MKKEAIRTWIHTSLENMFHRSWYRRCLASNRLTNTLASSSCRQRPLIAYLIYYSDNNCIQYTLVRFFFFQSASLTNTRFDNLKTKFINLCFFSTDNSFISFKKLLNLSNITLLNLNVTNFLKTSRCKMYVNVHVSKMIF